MFLKFRVKAAIAKFISMNNLHVETLQFLESNPLDMFFPLVEQRKFDANQGAVAVITATISHGAKNGGLIALQEHCPIVYGDLQVLWYFCGSLINADEHRWGSAIIVGDVDGNPFDYAERQRCIYKALSGFSGL